MASFHIREEGTDQESIQSSIIPDPEHHMGKRQKHQKILHTSHISFFVNTVCRSLDLGMKLSISLKIFITHSLVIETQSISVSIEVSATCR